MALSILPNAFSQPALTPEQVKKLNEFFKKEKNTKDPITQLRIGDLFRLGIFGKEKRKEAMTWYLKSAKQNDPRAFYRLGVAYLKGDKGFSGQGIPGIFEDQKKAFEYLHRAAKLGLPQAFGLVAISFESGRGTEKNLVSAYGWCFLHHQKSQNDRSEKHLIRIQKVMTPEEMKKGVAFADMLSKLISGLREEQPSDK